MDISNFIDKVYGVLPEKAVEPIEVIVDIGGQSIPLISGAINWYKFKKINEELNKLSTRINAVTEKMNDSENEVFIKQEIFPIILNNIINDEQNEKISVMLNGFEQIIDKNILDTDKIFHYYDVLKEMRVSEIVHLTENYVKPLENARNPYYLKLNPIRLNFQKSKEEREIVDLERYMDNKLHRLGILEYAKERIRRTEYKPREYKDFEGSKNNFKVNMDRFQISNFGLRFIEFFYNEDTSE
jgi:hypothetical protein